MRASMSGRIVLAAIIVMVVCALWIAPASSQSGGNLQVQRSVISGGGGRSTDGGNLQNEGTLGQPAAGSKTTAGPLSNFPGYWFAAVPQASPEAGPGNFALSLANYSVNEA